MIQGNSEKNRLVEMKVCSGSRHVTCEVVRKPVKLVVLQMCRAHPELTPSSDSYLSCVQRKNKMPSSRESRLSPAQGSFITLLPKPNFIQKLFNSVLLGNPYSLGVTHEGERKTLCSSQRSDCVINIKQGVADMDLELSRDIKNLESLMCMWHWKPQ